MNWEKRKNILWESGRRWIEKERERERGGGGVGELREVATLLARLAWHSNLLSDKGLSSVLANYCVCVHVFLVVSAKKIEWFSGETTTFFMLCFFSQSICLFKNVFFLKRGNETLD